MVMAIDTHALIGPLRANVLSNHATPKKEMTQPAQKAQGSAQ
jgi:hypothetical protein